MCRKLKAVRAANGLTNHHHMCKISDLLQYFAVDSTLGPLRTLCGLSPRIVPPTFRKPSVDPSPDSPRTLPLDLHEPSMDVGRLLARLSADPSPGLFANPPQTLSHFLRRPCHGLFPNPPQIPSLRTPTLHTICEPSANHPLVPWRTLNPHLLLRLSSVCEPSEPTMPRRTILANHT